MATPPNKKIAQRALAWIAGVTSGLLVAGIVVPFITTATKADDQATVDAVSQDFFNLMASLEFRFAATAILSFIAGFFLSDIWTRALSRSREAWAEKAVALSEALEPHFHEWLRIKASEAESATKEHPDLAAWSIRDVKFLTDASILREGAKRLNLPIPKPLTRGSRLRKFGDYLREVAPLAEGGYMTETRSKATSICREIDAD